MADPKAIKMGTKVEVIGKGVVGTVAYIGTTMFSSGDYYVVCLITQACDDLTPSVF